MSRIILSEPLEVGAEIQSGKKNYSLVGFEPHTKRDGSQTRLAVWKTDCSECGAEFMTRSPMLQLPESKRCAEHRRPGLRA